MLKKITVKSSNNLQIDLGHVLECMLFYQEVNLVCNMGFFVELVNSNQIYGFIELMKTNCLNVYVEENVFAYYQSDSHPNWHRIVLVKLNDISIFDQLEKRISEITNRRGYAKRLAKKIRMNSESFLNDVAVTNHVNEDFDDEVYVKRAIAYSANDYKIETPIEPELVKYRLQKIQGGILFDTNLNLKNITPKEGQNEFKNLTILHNILQTRADTTIASDFNSDLLTNTVNTRLLEYKVNDILSRSIKNTSSINTFSEIVLPDGKPIREVINSGERSLTEFRTLLDKAEKFKHWLDKLEDDSDILKEYYKEVSSESWIDKLPVKGFRWGSFTGASLLLDLAGPLGTAIGMGLSIGDSFLLDKMIKGWKPNTFINNDLNPFIKK